METFSCSENLEQKLKPSGKFWTLKKVVCIMIGAAVVGTYSTLYGIQKQDPMAILPAIATAVTYFGVAIGGLRLYLDSQSAPEKENE